MRKRSNKISFILLLGVSFIYFFFPASLFAENQRIKINIIKDGIYRIKGTDLKQLGISLPLDPSKIKMLHQGKEIPLYIEAKSFFNSEDSIVFYGTGLKKESQYYKFSSEDIYWLMLGDERTLNIFSRDAKPKGATTDSPVFFKTIIHAEKDNNYTYSIPLEENDDHWFWGDKIFRNNPPKEFNIELKNLSTEKDCNIKISLYGATDVEIENPDHNIKILVNDIEIGEAIWDGQVPYISSFHKETCPLNPGNNIIKISSIGNKDQVVDSIFLDWFEIEYWHTYTGDNNSFTFQGKTFSVTDLPNTITILNVTIPTQDNNVGVLDITDPGSPVFLKNFSTFNSTSKITLNFNETGSTVIKTYIASVLQTPKMSLDSQSNLHDTNNQADYIIITFDDFYDSIQRLANYREGKGLKVFTAKISDIYDEFSYGLPDPKAIRDFLTFTYNNWTKPAPTYVLLVGDANIDYKGNYGQESKNYVPVHLFTTSDDKREAPSDNWFVEFKENDLQPYMAIGRFPVKSSDEVNNIIDKIIKYETDSLPGWNKNALFVADDPDNDIDVNLGKSIIQLPIRDSGTESIENSSENSFFDYREYFSSLGNTISFQERRNKSYAVDDNKFSSLSDNLVKILPESYNISKIYVEDYPNLTNVDGRSNQDGFKIKSDIIDKINSGALITTYIGHGSINVWTAEDIFESSPKNNVEEMNNNGKLTFLMTFNCLNGYFISPFEGKDDPVPIAEAFLKGKDKGAVAVFSPTWLVLVDDHKKLASELYKSIFQDGETTLGKAVMLAKQSAFQKGMRPDNLETFTFFGDPATLLATNIVDKTNDNNVNVDNNNNNGGGGGGGCFIATAGIGSYIVETAYLILNTTIIQKIIIFILILSSILLIIYRKLSMTR